MSLKSALKGRLKHAVIRAGLEAVALTRAGSLWPAAAGRGMIFTLHHVRPARTEAFDPNAHLSITPEFLDQAIMASKEAGLLHVALEDLPELLADASDKRRFVSFTLDDGFRNNAEHAAPVFRRHGVPYTIFVAGGFVERTRSLWWETSEALLRKASAIQFDFGKGPETVPLNDTAQKLSAFQRLAAHVQTANEDEAVARIDEAARTHGIDPLGITAELTMDAAELKALATDPLARLGAHTLTHINMKRVDDERLHREIGGSAEAVERIVGRRPKTFAYPYGFPAAVGDREIRAVAGAGFTAAVTTQIGVLDAASLARPTSLNRVSLNGLYQKKRYVQALLSGIPARLM